MVISLVISFYSQAWNRQAFVWSELNRIEEAWESSKRSVAIDAENADIQRLHVDIEYRHRSAMEERQLQELDAAERERLKVVEAFIAQSAQHVADLLPAMRACSAECARSRLAQVHFRLSGALGSAVDMLTRSPPDTIPPELLQLVACAIDSQPLSIRAGEELGLLPALSELVVSTSSPANIRAESLRVLLRCCSPAAPTNIRTSILRNPVFVEAFCSEVSDTIISSKNTLNVPFIAECLSLLKEMVFSDEGRVNAEDSPCLVSSISSILASRDLMALWSSCVEVLVGCSQIGKLKEQFTAPLSDGRTPISLLLNIARLESDASVNCLTSLFNLTVESKETLRDLIAKEGGIEIAVSALNHPSEDSYALRSIQLLSRIATTDEVKTRLLEPRHYSLICQGIRDTCKHIQSIPSKREICGYLINTLACLTTPSPDCRNVALELGLVRHILQIFPEPKHELGVITPESVIQVPRDSVPVIMLGNAARCLMPYADDPEANYDIYLNRSLKGIEKLVCAMATVSDIRVRKNIAILLAKGCRLPAVRNHVSELRGIQMMVELQDQLI